MAARKSTGWLILIVLLTISCGSLSLETPIPGAETLQIDGVTQIVAPPTDLGMGRLFWSPDGTQLVFSYARTEMDDLLSPPSRYQILTTDIQGGEPQVIESSDESRDVLAWPINDRIALFASVDVQEGIWLMPSTGGEPKEFLFDAVQAIWSWDGEQIAYQRFQRGSQTNRLSIVVYSSNNNEERQVFTAE